MIRLSGITIENFKNVLYGQISLSASEEGPSILGVYGQNGSGKTSLIEALELLKYLLQGKTPPRDFSELIHVDSPYAKVTYEFEISLEEATPGKAPAEAAPAEPAPGAGAPPAAEAAPAVEATADTDSTPVYYAIKYGVAFRSGQGQLADGLADAPAVIDIFSEQLSYAPMKNGHPGRYFMVLDTASGTRPFGPGGRYALLFGKQKKLKTDLQYRMEFARMIGTSAVFCQDFQSMLEEKHQPSEEADRIVQLIRELRIFGCQGLFVISKSDIGEISLPSGTLIPMNQSVTISQGAEEELKSVIRHMNLVLAEIVPGLEIDYRILGRELMLDGQGGVQVQLVSEKNEKTIPLKYESQGIKKIISVLHLLIRVYNQDSITVAIDELDAGIFEYLLGELLRILASKGRGQLIFTSHNLRPLETIDKEYVAFTTTNPEKRYLRMSGVKAASNLRDFYYRDLQLGGQKEDLYEPTNNYDIALAFRQAGEIKETRETRQGDPGHPAESQQADEPRQAGAGPSGEDSHA